MDAINNGNYHYSDESAADDMPMDDIVVPNNDLVDNK
jgi:hypothetical protein